MRAFKQRDSGVPICCFCVDRLDPGDGFWTVQRTLAFCDLEEALNDLEVA